MRSSRFAPLWLLLSFLTIPASAGSWERVGSRWATKIADNGQEEALYDLSFPYLFQKTRLSALDVSNEGLSAVRERLRSSQERGADEAMEALDRVSIPPNWWRDLRFKAGAVGAVGGAPPRSFRLSDLDIRDRAGRALSWRALVPKKYRKAIAEAAPEELDFFDFESLELVLEGNARDGSPIYGIHWNPLPTEGARSLNPRKLIDFQNPGSILIRSLMMEGVRKAVSELIGLIGIPVVSAVVSATTGAFFSYRDLLVRTHGQMAWEMLRVASDDADASQNHSPYRDWSSSKIRSGVLSITYDNSGLYTPLNWILTPPLKAWARSLPSERKTARTMEERLRKKGVEPSWVNPRWALGGVKLYQMARAKMLGLPSASIDFARPLEERRVRGVIAVGEITLRFAAGFIPIPFVGSILTGAYGTFQANPMRTSIAQEARLIAYLEELPEEGSSPIDSNETLDILYGQRLNPFALNREKTRKLIELRKKHLGI